MAYMETQIILEYRLLFLNLLIFRLSFYLYVLLRGEKSGIIVLIFNSVELSFMRVTLVVNRTRKIH